MQATVQPKKVFLEDGVFKKLLPDFLSRIQNLNNSRPSIGGMSFREIWGLAIITALRKSRESNKDWLFIIDKDFNDDGSIGSFVVENNFHRIDYYENVEQVYLPEFFKRKDDEEYGEYLMRFLEEKKLNKGSEYKLNKSLIILNDVSSVSPFEWQDFAKRAFPNDQINFLHTYFIGFQGMNESFIKYHIFSFTNQVHRQFLNGQFDLYIYLDGSYQIKTMQEINLLSRKAILN